MNQPPEPPTPENQPASPMGKTTLNRRGRDHFQQLKRHPVPPTRPFSPAGSVASSDEFPPLPVPLVPGQKIVESSDENESLGRGQYVTSMTLPRKPPAEPISVTDRIGESHGIEHFETRGEIGRGAMGIVELAYDPTLRRELAVKRLVNVFDNQARARFIEEAQVTAQLEHPNIVPVHTFGHDANRRPYLVMKRVYGETLADKIAAWKREAAADSGGEWVAPLGPARLHEVLQIFSKICEAIAFAHYRGVIHRDLKPANIMVGKFGEVQVMDWGIAKPVATPNGKPTRAITTDRQESTAPALRTVKGAIIGTPTYMSPEQARGEVDAIDHRSDIFGLGAILYHMLTLERPYPKAGMLIVLELAQTGSFLPPCERTPERGIPRELDAIVMTAMATDPAHRYASVADLKAAIDGFMAREIAPPTPMKRGVAAGHVIAIAAAVALVFGIGGAILGMNGVGSNAPTEPPPLAANAGDIARAEDAATLARVREWATAHDWPAVTATLAVPGARLFSPDATALRDAVQAALDAGQSPSEEIIKLGRARAEMLMGEFDRVLAMRDALGGAISCDAADFLAAGLLADSWHFDMKKALAIYDAGIAAHPDFLPLRHFRALAHVWLDDREAAIRDADWLATHAPDSLWLHLTRGELLWWENGEAARQHAFALQKLAPDSAHARYICARIFMHSDWVTQATENFARAVELDPQFSQAHYWQVRFFWNTANPAAATAALEDAKQAVPDSFYFAVETDAVRAMQLNPRHWRAYLQMLLGNRDQPLLRKLCYDRAMELCPIRERRTVQWYFDTK